VPLAVASTKPTVRVVQHTTALGIDGYFAHLQGTDQPPYKPDPAILHLVLGRFNVEPQGCWMVGDQVTDIQAGLAAGMQTLGVSWSETGEEALRAAGADQVAGSVAEMGRILSR
jgi:phosphoglycolate phosphatase